MEPDHILGRKLLMLALFVPVFNEEKHIETFLASLMSQDIFNFNYDIEIRFYDGCSKDSTVQKITKFMNDRNQPFEIIENKERYVAHGFNHFLSELQGGYLMRMDAHQKYPQNYLSQLVKIAENISEFGCIGPRITMSPSDNSLVSRSIACVLNSKIGVGASIFRTKGKFKGVLDVDTVPFGIWRVDTLKKVSGMNLRLNRNQDDDLNRRLKLLGSRIILVGDLEVICFPRDNLKKHFLMFYQYGLYKPISKGGYEKIIFSKSILPSVFLIVIAILSIIWGAKVFLLLLLTYLVMASTIRSAPNPDNKTAVFLLNAFILFVTHTAYGLGVMKGLAMLLLERKRDF